MRDLIEALQIFSEYFTEDSFHSGLAHYPQLRFKFEFPTHCEHDVLLIFPDLEVSAEDKARLDELGFSYGEHEVAGDEECFYSYKYGSC